MIRPIYLPILIICVMGLTSCSRHSNHQDLQTENRPANATLHLAIESPDDTAVRSERVELEEPLNIANAISAALLYNPELKAYSWDIRAADSRVAQARLMPNPELALGVEEFGGRGPRQGFDGVETTIAITQPLETGGKRKHRSKVASLETAVARRRYELTRLDVVRRTKQAYLEIQGLQQQAALAESQMDLASKLANTVERRVEAGKDTPSEAAKARIELSQTQLRRSQILGELADARSALAMLWGAASSTFDQIETCSEAGPDLTPLEELRDQARAHPEILRWKVEQDLGRARLGLAKSKSHSDVAVSAGLKRLEQENDNTAIVGLAIPLPLFNRNQGDIAAAQSELAKVHERHAQAVVQVQSRLSRSYRRLELALSHRAMLEDMVLANANTVFRAARKGYEEGKIDYLKLLDAQRTLFQSQAQLVKARVSVDLAVVDLEYAVGHVQQSTINAVNENEE